VHGERKARLPVVALALSAFGALLIAVIWYDTVGRARAELAEAEQSEFRKNEKLALALEVQTTRLLRGADDLLTILANHYEREEAPLPVERLVPPAVARNAGFVLIARVDANGNMISASPDFNPISVADREYFRKHQSTDTGKLLITGPLIGRLTGVPIVQLTRRINRADGSFGGVMLLAVEPAYFTDIFQSGGSARGDVMSLVRPDGYTLARRLGSRTTFGEDISGSPLMMMQARHPVGHYLGRGALDGVLKFFSYRTLPGYELIATVGTNADVVLAPVRERRRTDYMLAAIATGFIAFFCAGLIAVIHHGQVAERERTRIARGLAHTMQQQEQRYRAIFEGVTNGIVIVGRDGRIVAANPAAEVMHGWAEGELVGKPAGQLIDPAEAGILRILESDAPWNGPRSWEARAIRRDGERLDVVLSTSRVEIGGEANLLLVVTNVSKEKSLQHQLEHSARVASLGRVAAGIAHEMNNVLMGILPFAEILTRSGRDSPQVANAAAQIARSVERGRAATQGILRFTRAVNEPEMKAFGAGPFMTALANELHESMPDALAFEVGCENGLHLFGDPSQLQQVVTNLVANAKDATPAGGTIAVRLNTLDPEDAARFALPPHSAGEWAHLVVTDTGPGIAPAVFDRIFEPLFTTKGKAGSGLGLPIVKQVVSAHGGRIDVANIPGGGAAFHVLLRKADPPASDPAASATIDPWATIRSVMIVDDEDAIGEGLTGLLHMEGVACEWVDRGQAALRRLEHYRPDLLILDIGLPDVQGTEVYERASAIHPGILTIFSTGHGDQRLIDALHAPRNVRVLAKPWDVAMLRACVVDLLVRK